MPKLSDVNKEIVKYTEAITIPFGDVTLTCSYNSASITGEMIERIDEAVASDHFTYNLITDIVQSIVTSWDLTDDNNKVIDVQDTKELYKIPLQVLIAIVFKIMKAQQPKN